VITNAGAEMAIVSAWVATVLELSFTCAVNVVEPGVVGVPEIAPAGDNVSPAGKAPEATDHTNPPAPPVADRVWLYAVPTTPFGKELVVTANAGPVMAIVSFCVATVLELSFTCAVNVVEPGVVGVPEIAPAGDNVNPAGREPELTDQT
jgi:hypothetical protein